MNASKEVPLIFTLTYDELIGLLITKEGFFRRDQKDLKSRGITVERIDEFAANRQLLLSMPHYAVENNTRSIALKECRIKKSEIGDALNEIKLIAENTFGLKGILYIPFNVSGIKKMSYEKILDLVPDFVKFGTANIIPMRKKGLTKKKLTDITSLAAELTTLLSVPSDSKSDLDAVTIARHVLENSLFEEMRNMCQTGRIFYRKSNKVKVADYLIYDKKQKVTNRSGIVKSNFATTRKAKKLIDKTRIRMKVSTGISLEFYFGMTKDSPPTAKTLTVLNNTKAFVTSTASELGYDLAGGIIHLIIRNPNEVNAKFLIKIG